MKHVFVTLIIYNQQQMYCPIYWDTCKSLCVTYEFPDRTMHPDFRGKLSLNPLFHWSVKCM